MRDRRGEASGRALNVMQTRKKKEECEKKRFNFRVEE